jgi:hypothetical protein
MGFVRKILPAAAIVAVFAASMASAAEAPEPLIVTQLADPDPNYVPPPELRHGQRYAAPEDESPAIDAAMADFGRALGQAVLVQQLMIEQRCKSSEASAASGTDRLAWEAACKYTRH